MLQHTMPRRPDLPVSCTITQCRGKSADGGLPRWPRCPRIYAGWRPGSLSLAACSQRYLLSQCSMAVRTRPCWPCNVLSTDLAASMEHRHCKIRSCLAPAQCPVVHSRPWTLRDRATGLPGYRATGSPDCRSVLEKYVCAKCLYFVCLLPIHHHDEGCGRCTAIIVQLYNRLFWKRVRMHLWRSHPPKGTPKVSSGQPVACVEFHMYFSTSRNAHGVPYFTMLSHLIQPFSSHLTTSPPFSRFGWSDVAPVGTTSTKQYIDNRAASKKWSCSATLHDATRPGNGALTSHAWGDACIEHHSASSTHHRLSLGGAGEGKVVSLSSSQSS